MGLLWGGVEPGSQPPPARRPPRPLPRSRGGRRQRAACVTLTLFKQDNAGPRPPRWPRTCPEPRGAAAGFLGAGRSAAPPLCAPRAAGPSAGARSPHWAGGRGGPGVTPSDRKGSSLPLPAPGRGQRTRWVPAQPPFLPPASPPTHPPDAGVLPRPGPQRTFLSPGVRDLGHRGPGWGGGRCPWGDGAGGPGPWQPPRPWALLLPAQARGPKPTHPRPAVCSPTPRPSLPPQCGAQPGWGAGAGEGGGPGLPLCTAGPQGRRRERLLWEDSGRRGTEGEGLTGGPRESTPFPVKREPLPVCFGVHVLAWAGGDPGGLGVRGERVRPGSGGAARVGGPRKQGAGQAVLPGAPGARNGGGLLPRGALGGASGGGSEEVRAAEAPAPLVGRAWMRCRPRPPHSPGPATAGCPAPTLPLRRPQPRWDSTRCRSRPDCHPARTPVCPSPAPERWAPSLSCRVVSGEAEGPGPPQRLLGGGAPGSRAAGGEEPLRPSRGPPPKSGGPEALPGRAGGGVGTGQRTDHLSDGADGNGESAQGHGLGRHRGVQRPGADTPGTPHPGSSKRTVGTARPVTHG